MEKRGGTGGMPPEPWGVEWGTIRIGAEQSKAQFIEWQKMWGSLARWDCLTAGEVASQLMRWPHIWWGSLTAVKQPPNWWGCLTCEAVTKMVRRPFKFKARTGVAASQIWGSLTTLMPPHNCEATLPGKHFEEARSIEGTWKPWGCLMIFCLATIRQFHTL